ncbi:fungal-specific transcription factor domain-containing protein [Colletotrichum phormii]|uniref:Fungal-specific transcription factor domain-containing protein n=1 Tax=Colletotrichum phormii TaxID=359342 RepID=A0AAJ0E8I3_9PEZI|nr:fungal-specific transcription factor domain-containing protein [Colletotrichum phormii]KAK1622621.1 fungal-specific transcription factor domain-containing protein [Colletotrichum phormii]
MLACIGCKRKKLKCDGQSPKCQNCVRTGRDCLVEDPGTGLHRPRDYMKSLEARVAYLEGLLQQARPEVALDHFGANNEGGGRGREAEQHAAAAASSHGGPTQAMSIMHMPSALAPNLQGHHSSFEDVDFSRALRAPSVDADDHHVDTLSSEVALLCLSAAGREPHYFGPSSAVSFSRIVSATMGLASTGGSSQHSHAGREKDISPEVVREVPLRLPSPTLRANLSEAYFNNIHPQYPFLHKPTFQIWEETCLKASLDGDLSSVNGSTFFFVLIAYYSMALDHISAVLDLDSLESIQAILACAVYSIRSPVGVSLWKVSGMAIRHCIELGYHRSAERYHKNTDALTKEMSKRCFWVAYDIDRVVAFTLGRPVGIPDDSIDVELPLDIDDENVTSGGLLAASRISSTDPPTLMTGFIHAIKLRRLWTKISDNLYPPTTRRCGCGHTATIESLRQELEEWRAKTPDQLNYSRAHPLSVFTSRSWFQLAYDHSILLLYRHYMMGGSPANHPTPDGGAAGSASHGGNLNDNEATERVLEECAVRAREMCMLYRRVYQSSSVQFTWGSLHILFLGGLTYLYCLWRSKRVRDSTRQADVVTTCMACTTVLIIIAERWNLATSYRDIFEALSQRTISMVCNDGQKPAPSNASLPAIGPGPGADMHAAFVGGAAPSMQDWIMGLDDLSIPQESEWLVQELLQGVRDY